MEPVLTYPEDYFTNFDKYHDRIYFICPFITNTNKIIQMCQLNSTLYNINKNNSIRYPEYYFENVQNSIDYQKKVIQEFLIHIHQTNEYISHLKNKN